MNNSNNQINNLIQKFQRLRIDNNKKTLSNFLLKKNSVYKYFNIDRNFTDLKYLLNNENVKNTFKAIGTKAYVETFYANKNNLKLLTDYQYFYIYFNLMNDINNHIIKQSDLNENIENPLQYDESLYLIFKGGTTMNFMYDKLCRHISEVNPEHICNIDTGDDLNNIKKNFKINDIDMSFHINSNNDNRFNILFSSCTQIIAKHLEELCFKFDYLYLRYLNNNDLRPNVNPELQSYLNEIYGVNVETPGLLKNVLEEIINRPRNEIENQNYFTNNHLSYKGNNVDYVYNNIFDLINEIKNLKEMYHNYIKLPENDHKKDVYTDFCNRSDSLIYRFVKLKIYINNEYRIPNREHIHKLYQRKSYTDVINPLVRYIYEFYTKDLMELSIISEFLSFRIAISQKAPISDYVLFGVSDAGNEVITQQAINKKYILDFRSHFIKYVNYLLDLRYYKLLDLFTLQEGVDFKQSIINNAIAINNELIDKSINQTRNIKTDDIDTLLLDPQIKYEHTFSPEIYQTYIDKLGNNQKQNANGSNYLEEFHILSDKYNNELFYQLNTNEEGNLVINRENVKIETTTHCLIRNNDNVFHPTKIYGFIESSKSDQYKNLLKKIVLNPSQDILVNEPQNNGCNIHNILLLNNIQTINNTNTFSINLFRMKFNININNLFTHKIKIKNDDTLSFSEIDDFNIAVEALDLTIPNNIDSFHKMQTEIELKNHPTIIEFDYRDVYNVNNPFGTRDRIFTYSIPGFIADLDRILFILSIFPWIENKYTKRLSRFIFYSCMHFQNLHNNFPNVKPSPLFLLNDVILSLFGNIVIENLNYSNIASNRVIPSLRITNVDVRDLINPIMNIILKQNAYDYLDTIIENNLIDSGIVLYEILLFNDDYLPMKGFFTSIIFFIMFIEKLRLKLDNIMLNTPVEERNNKIVNVKTKFNNTLKVLYNYSNVNIKDSSIDDININIKLFIIQFREYVLKVLNERQIINNFFNDQTIFQNFNFTTYEQ